MATNEQQPITLFYAPNEPKALKSLWQFIPYFEDLRIGFGENGAVEKMLQGGTFRSTEDTAWIVMSYAIRERNANPELMRLYEHSEEFGWHRIRFDSEGELTDDLVCEKSSIRVKLLF